MTESSKLDEVQSVNERNVGAKEVAELLLQIMETGEHREKFEDEDLEYLAEWIKEKANPRLYPPPAKIVEHDITWEDMAGDSELEKRINCYLTQQFIVNSGVPADECLGEAKHIMKLIEESKSNSS